MLNFKSLLFLCSFEDLCFERFKIFHNVHPFPTTEEVNVRRNIFKEKQPKKTTKNTDMPGRNSSKKFLFCKSVAWTFLNEIVNPRYSRKTSGIAPSATKLSNYSLKTTVFLRWWKTAKVTPLIKGGNSGKISNFWPILVLPALSKVIERHVHDSLNNYIHGSLGLVSDTIQTALIQIIDQL